MLNKRKSVKRKLFLLAIVIIALLASGIWMLGKSKSNGNEPRKIDFEINNLSTAKDGENSISRKAELSDITDKEVKGVAVVSEADSFYTTLIKAKLPDLVEDGEYYSAWLIKDTPFLDYYQIGELYKSEEYYKITQVSQLDRSDYDEVVITVQSSDGYTFEPYNIVLRGSF